MFYFVGDVSPSLHHRPERSGITSQSVHCSAAEKNCFYRFHKWLFNPRDSWLNVIYRTNLLKLKSDLFLVLAAGLRMQFHKVGESESLWQESNSCFNGKQYLWVSLYRISSLCWGLEVLGLCRDRNKLKKQGCVCENPFFSRARTCCTDRVNRFYLPTLFLLALLASSLAISIY